MFLRGHPGLATLALCFLLFLLHPAAAFGNDCLPADIEMTSQEAVDNFQANHGGGEVCTAVTGNLRIGDFTDIVNLDGLAALERVDGDVFIAYNEYLSDIRGLSALAFVGGDLHISNNRQLLVLDGLSALASIGGNLILDGRYPFAGHLENIDGLSALTSVGGDIRIEANYYLQRIDFLRNFTRINGSLILYWNSSLENLDALQSITEVGSDLTVSRSYSLTNIDGLRSLARVGGNLALGANPELQDLDGLASLANVGGSLWLSGDPSGASESSLQNIRGLSSLTSVGGSLYLDSLVHLSDLDGLQALTEVGLDLELRYNIGLMNIDALSSLSRVGGTLKLIDEDALTDVNGFSNLTSVGSWLSIADNDSLGNLDGLSSLQELESLTIEGNPQLADCLGVVRLVDMFDDYEPGPASSASPIPDVESDAIIERNAKGCNSVEEILGSAPLDGLNPGLNDAWYNFATDGQGFFISVFPTLSQVFLAWFTYDIERPGDDVIAYLGEPGHRWLTAQGGYSGNEALLDIWLTRGGVFDSAKPVPQWLDDGELLLEFTTCNAGSVHYDIASINKHGSIPIERVALDNVALCYALNASLEQSFGANGTQ